MNLICSDNLFTLLAILGLWYTMKQLWTVTWKWLTLQKAPGGSFSNWIKGVGREVKKTFFSIFLNSFISTCNICPTLAILWSWKPLFSSGGVERDCQNLDPGWQNWASYGAFPLQDIPTMVVFWFCLFVCFQLFAS